MEAKLRLNQGDALLERTSRAVTLYYWLRQRSVSDMYSWASISDLANAFVGNYNSERNAVYVEGLLREMTGMKMLVYVNEKSVRLLPVPVMEEALQKLMEPPAPARVVVLVSKDKNTKKKIFARTGARTREDLPKSFSAAEKSYQSVKDEIVSDENRAPTVSQILGKFSSVYKEVYKIPYNKELKTGYKQFESASSLYGARVVWFMIDAAFELVRTTSFSGVAPATFVNSNIVDKWSLIERAQRHAGVLNREGSEQSEFTEPQTYGRKRF